MYAKWKACERFNILPPEMEWEWDEMNNWQKSLLISYSQIRDYEEEEAKFQELKVIAGAP